MIIQMISVAKILLHNNPLCHRSKMIMLQCNWACLQKSKFCLLLHQVVTEDKITKHLYNSTNPPSPPILVMSKWHIKWHISVFTYLHNYFGRGMVVNSFFWFYPGSLEIYTQNISIWTLNSACNCDELASKDDIFFISVTRLRFHMNRWQLSHSFFQIYQVCH